jgi:dTDP-4-dehydrorhamnose reductase
VKEIKKILVTGSKGQLGRCLQDAVLTEKGERRKEEGEKTLTFFFTDIDELDITDIAAVADYAFNNKIDCIVNVAAYTAVDKAESEPLVAFSINGDGVWNLAHICMEQNVFLIHISTDYVFDGTASSPYNTNTLTNPVSVYGKSKLAGEKAIKDAQIPSVIIRTSWLYSEYGHNFLNTMLRLGKEKEEIFVVDDQFGAPTNANDLADAILMIISQTYKITKPEIFHYANEGVTTWCGFAKEIMDTAQQQCEVNPIFTAEYPTPAVRPAYSVFELSKIKKKFNIQIPDWKDSLRNLLFF